MRKHHFWGFGLTTILVLSIFIGSCKEDRKPGAFTIIVPSPITHPIQGYEDCLAPDCHGSGPFATPGDHAGQTDATCLNCHKLGNVSATPVISPSTSP